MSLRHKHTYKRIRYGWCPTTTSATGTWVRPQSEADPECDASLLLWLPRFGDASATNHSTHAKAEADADADVNADSGDDNDKRNGDDRERDFSHKWRSSNVAKSSCYCSGFLLLLHANRSATSRLCIINSFCMSGSTTPFPSRPYRLPAFMQLPQLSATLGSLISWTFESHSWVHS